MIRNVLRTNIEVGFRNMRSLSSNRVLFNSLPDKYSEIDTSNSGQKAVVSGVPQDLTQRVVRIYKEAKPATQSSNDNGKFWKIDWEIAGKSNRWENDLIGYQGTADAMNATVLKFDSKEAAIRFAEEQQWIFVVSEPKERKFVKKDYSANFYHSSGPLKHIRTK